MNKKLVGIGLLLITLTVFMSCDLFFDSTRPKSVVSISIKKLPDKIEYLSSEKFDSSGMTVLLTYSDNSTEVSDSFITSPADNSSLSSYDDGVVPITVYTPDMKVSTSFNILITDTTSYDSENLLYATAVENTDYEKSMISGGDNRFSYYIFKIGSIKNLLLDDPQFFYHGGGSQSLTDISSITSSEAIETTTGQAVQQTLSWENENSYSVSLDTKVKYPEVAEIGIDLCWENSQKTGVEKVTSWSESFTSSYEYSVTKSQSKTNGFTDSSATGWWLVGFRGNVDVYAVVVMDNETQEKYVSTYSAVKDTFYTQEFLGDKTDVLISDNFDTDTSLSFDLSILNSLDPIDSDPTSIGSDIIVFYEDTGALVVDLSETGSDLDELDSNEFKDGVLSINPDYWGVDCHSIEIIGNNTTENQSTLSDLAIQFAGEWDSGIKIILTDFAATAPDGKSEFDFSKLTNCTDPIDIYTYGEVYLGGGDGNSSQSPGKGINAEGKDVALIATGENDSLTLQGGNGLDGSIDADGQDGQISIVADSLTLEGNISLYGGDGGNGGNGANGKKGVSSPDNGTRTDGKPGHDGGDGGTGARAVDIENTYLDNASLILKSGDGGTGGNGGTGGAGGDNSWSFFLDLGASGGDGGDGGNGGDTYFADSGLNITQKISSTITRNNGKVGTGGTGGAGGAKGYVGTTATNNPHNGASGKAGTSGVILRK